MKYPKLFKEEPRFIIKYTLGTFTTFVEVFSNWICKTYYTKYDAATTPLSLAELEDMAEQAALDKYAEVYYDYKNN